MSVRFDVWIKCDRCGETVFCDGNISATRARQIAKAAGWRPSTSHGDHCPACLKQQKAIGESTARELAYAQKLGKRVRYWSEEL